MLKGDSTEKRGETLKKKDRVLLGMNSALFDMEIWALQEEQEFLFDFFGRVMCTHAVKAGCAREHQCHLLWL